MGHMLEHRIRQRAYEIWNAEGRADGKADEHWFAAEREILLLLSQYVGVAAYGDGVCEICAVRSLSEQERQQLWRGYSATGFARGNSAMRATHARRLHGALR